MNAAPDTPSDHSRLRSSPLKLPLQVVLVEPEIPPNTGNAARLCAATGCHLHLVHPLGFRVDEKAVRRAGLDYWHLVRVIEHPSWDAFCASLPADARLFLFSGKAAKSFYEPRYQPGDYLVFGKESTGLPEHVVGAFPDNLVAIPTLGAVRSLNLANCVALGVFEALRQMQAFEHTQLIPLGPHSGSSGPTTSRR